MRIAFLLAAFPQVSETFILSQITGLIDRGHYVHIYSNAHGNRGVVHHDVDAYHLLDKTSYTPRVPRSRLRRFAAAAPLAAGGLVRNPALFARVLNPATHGRLAPSLRDVFMVTPFAKAPPYDIVYCHFGTAGSRGVDLRALGAVRGRIVTCFHGFDLTKLLYHKTARVYDTLFARGDLFLTISEHWAQRLVQLGCPPHKIKVHHMGVDLRRFCFVPRSGTTSTNGPLKILTVARLVEKKGIEYALRAMARLMPCRPALRYFVVGEGPLEERLRSMCVEFGIDEAVYFLGARTHEEIATLMREASLYLAPSVTAADGDQEGIPVSLMEAMASGLPVVATRHSGIPELVIDGESGFLVEEKNVMSLTDKIRTLIEHPQLRHRMAKAARRVIERDFNLELLNDRLVEILADVTAGEPDGRWECSTQAKTSRPARERV